MIIIGIVGFYVAIKHPERLQNFKPFLPNGWERLLVTMGFTYVAFEGYEVIAQAGDEAIDPKKNLPKAMIYSVLIVTLTYVAVASQRLLLLKPEQLIRLHGNGSEATVQKGLDKRWQNLCRMQIHF